MQALNWLISDKLKLACNEYLPRLQYFLIPSVTLLSIIISALHPTSILIVSCTRDIPVDE